MTDRVDCPVCSGSGGTKKMNKDIPKGYFVENSDVTFPLPLWATMKKECCNCDFYKKEKSYHDKEGRIK